MHPFGTPVYPFPRERRRSPKELDRTLVASLSPNDARQRVSGFLAAAGFKTLDGGNPLVCQRSNKLETMMATAPDDWQAVVKVAIRRHGSSQSQLRVQYAISTFGQLVTDAERVFFDTEIAERRTTLEASGVDPRVTGALLIGVGALIAVTEHFSLRCGVYEPKALLVEPPAVLVGFFQVLAGRPEHDADGEPPRWWKAGGAFAIVAGLLLSALLFYPFA